MSQTNPVFVEIPFWRAGQEGGMGRQIGKYVHVWCFKKKKETKQAVLEDKKWSLGGGAVSDRLV